MPTSTPSPTVAILTLGCKVNQYESEAIAEAFEAAGYTPRPATEACDVYVVNTCTVTAESDRKARQLIRRLIAQAPGAFVMVTGCSAQAHADTIATIPGVDAVIGNREKLAVVAVAKQLLAAGEKPLSPLVEVPALEGSRFEPMTITRFGRTRAYVKIEDGCESRCAYCAIPAARGPIRSKPATDVLAEVSGLTAAGCREIVLTGIETGSWGRDLGDSRLEDLLEALSDVPNLGRIRLGSLDPTTMTESFVSRIAALPYIAPHFHLSMQSGCSATLARMRRKYNTTQATAAMARVRAAIPGAKFTTDMIVGFPGETEEEFAESLAFAEAAGFLHIHVFPYSRRDGTLAATMQGQVPEAIKHERVAALSAVSEASCGAILDDILARHAAGSLPTLTVLPETRGKGFYHAHTPDFIEIKLLTDQELPAVDLPVIPLSREGETLICTPADS